MNAEETIIRDRLCGEAVRLMGRLAHTVRSLRTYPLDSPAIRFGLEGMAHAATAIYDLQGRTEIILAGDRVRVGAYPMTPPPGMLAAVRELRAWLRERGVAGLEVRAEPSAEDIRHALRALVDTEKGGNKDQGAADGALNRALVADDILSVRFLPSRGGSEEESDEEPAVIAMRLYLRGVRGVQRLAEQGYTPAVSLELSRLVQGLVDLLAESPPRALSLVGPRQEIPYEFYHPLHRCLLALGVGRRLGMQEKELLELGLCALTVDVGQAALPEEVRTSQARYSDLQQEIMRRHPVESVRALLHADRLSPLLRRRMLVAFEHHLGYDRSGYPPTLLWPELHPFSRIIAAAETYDALLRGRPWRPELTPREALKALRHEAGGRLDPMMVDELVDLLQTHCREVLDAR